MRDTLSNATTDGKKERKTTTTKTTATTMTTTVSITTITGNKNIMDRSVGRRDSYRWWPVVSWASYLLWILYIFTLSSLLPSAAAAAAAATSPRNDENLTLSLRILNALQLVDDPPWPRTFYTSTPMSINAQGAIPHSQVQSWGPHWERKRDEALKLLELSWESSGTEEAGLRIGEFYLYGHFGLQRNVTKALEYFYQVANKHGNPIAQRNIAFIRNVLYQTHTSSSSSETVENDGNTESASSYELTEKDAVANGNQRARGFLQMTMAAAGGDPQALMTLGYQHSRGINTEPECTVAIRYYQRVAARVIKKYRSGPPGGLFPPPAKSRLSQEDGGVYPFNAAQRVPNDDAGASYRSNAATTDDDILQYYKYLAERGDPIAQVSLGHIFFYGTAKIKQDFRVAYQYLLKAAREYFENEWNHHASDGDYQEAEFKSHAAKAAGLLGEMYRRGDFVTKNYNIAFQWYERGVKLGDPVSRTGLGLMYSEGHGVKRDMKKAEEHFLKAAEGSNREAFYQLGRMRYERQERGLGVEFLKRAAADGHVAALYTLGMLHEHGEGVAQNCDAAVEFYKSVVEKGFEWIDPIISKAYEATAENDNDTALLLYLMGAELGIEVAQANVAWLISSGICSEIASLSQTLDLDRLAYIYWSRAANQLNVEARVKLGDMAYYGVGTPHDKVMAASHYLVAAEEHRSPLAFWNLAYMFENGIGVRQDFHMAKRYYELIPELDPDANIVAQLSLIKLYVRMAFDYLYDFVYGDNLRKWNFSGKGEDIKTVHERAQSAIKEREKPVDRPGQVAAPGDADKSPEQESMNEMSPDAELEWGEYRRPSRHRTKVHWLLRGLLAPQAAMEDVDNQDFENVVIVALCVVFGILVYARQTRWMPGGRGQEGLRRARASAGPSGRRRGTRRRRHQGEVPGPSTSSSTVAPSTSASQTSGRLEEGSSSHATPSQSEQEQVTGRGVKSKRDHETSSQLLPRASSKGSIPAATAVAGTSSSLVTSEVDACKDMGDKKAGSAAAVSSPSSSSAAASSIPMAKPLSTSSSASAGLPHRDQLPEQACQDRERSSPSPPTEAPADNQPPPPPPP